MAEPIYLELALNREETVDIEARTVKLAFVSDKPIEHWFGFIKLSFEKGHIRTKRSARGLPLCLGHDLSVHVGKINNITYDKGVGRGLAKISRNRDDVLNDIEDDILTEVSVGFMIYELEVESEKDGLVTYICRDWEPYEASLVAAPKDISVGVGRELEIPAPPAILEPALAGTREIKSTTENTMSDKNDNEPVVPVETRTAEQIVRDRENTIVEWAGIFGEEGKEVARGLLAERSDISQEDVRIAIKAKRDAKPQIAIPVAPATGTELARALPRHSKVTAFTGEGANERAYRFGQWLLGRALFDPNSPGCVAARKFCDENGLTRAMSEGVNETGGYTVPTEFSNDIIDLREQYGVFRKYAKVVPMASDTLIIPRRVSGLTPYFVAEAGSITASDKGWDQVELVAKKLAVLARYSTEVNEDSIIDFANDLASEIGYAFANKEDECGFNATGTSTDGGMTGVCQRLLDVYTTTGGVGLKLGAGNAYSELLLTDFEAVVGLLPEYADPNAKWFVSRSFYWNVMVRVLLAAGGVTATEIEDTRKQIFMGYPVVFSQVLPKTEANGQVCALFGDLAKAAILGTRRDTTIMTSEHSRFANDQIEIRGTERFDINVHSVGDATNAGPIVGLITASS